MYFLKRTINWKAQRLIQSKYLKEASREIFHKELLKLSIIIKYHMRLKTVKQNIDNFSEEDRLALKTWYFLYVL